MGYLDLLFYDLLLDIHKFILIRTSEQVIFGTLSERSSTYFGSKALTMQGRAMVAKVDVMIMFLHEGYAGVGEVLAHGISDDLIVGA